MGHCDNHSQRNGHQSICAWDQADVGYQEAGFEAPDTKNIADVGNFVSIEVKMPCRKTQKEEFAYNGAPTYCVYKDVSILVYDGIISGTELNSQNQN